MNAHYSCPPVSRLARELNMPIDTATKLRALVKGRLAPSTFDSVRKWISTCHSEPVHIEQILTAANELLDVYGSEVIRSTKSWDSFWCDARFAYINMGDVYAPTLMFNTVSKSFSVACIGDVVDRLATANELMS